MNLNAELEAALLDLTQSGTSARATLQFKGSEVFFDGHFPERPVLPAVVQVAVAMFVADRVAGRALQLVEVTRATFLNPTGPGVPLQLEVSLEPAEKGRLRVKALLREGEKPVAELSLRVVPQDAPSQ